MTAAQSAAIAALQAAGASAYLVEMAKAEFSDAAPPPLPPPQEPATYTTAAIKAAGATKIMDVAVPVSGVAPKQLTSRGDGMREGKRGLVANDTLAIEFKAPPADPIFQLTALGELNQPHREWSLSAKPCDWSASAIYRAMGADATPALNLALATVKPNSAHFTLEPGRTYYVTTRLRDQTSTANCNISVAVANPRP